jgi:hypothetical protein
MARRTPWMPTKHETFVKIASFASLRCMVCHTLFATRFHILPDW